MPRKRRIARKTCYLVELCSVPHLWYNTLFIVEWPFNANENGRNSERYPGVNGIGCKSEMRFRLSAKRSYQGLNVLLEDLYFSCVSFTSFQIYCFFFLKFVFARVVYYWTCFKHNTPRGWDFRRYSSYFLFNVKVPAAFDNRIQRWMERMCLQAVLGNQQKIKFLFYYSTFYFVWLHSNSKRLWGRSKESFQRQIAKSLWWFSCIHRYESPSLLTFIIRFECLRIDFACQRNVCQNGSTVFSLEYWSRVISKACN